MITSTWMCLQTTVYHVEK